MTQKEFDVFIESAYLESLKIYADYANAKYFNDTSLKVSTNDIDNVFTKMMSLSRNVSKLTYVKRVARGQRTLLDKAELDLIARYMQAKLLAQRLGDEKFAELQKREKENSLDIRDLIYDLAFNKYVRPNEQQGRRYNNDEKLFADLGISPIRLEKMNEYGYTIHKASLQPMTRYRDISTKGITNVGQFMLYTPQDLLNKGFKKGFVSYLTICGHTASARDIVAMQTGELFADMNEMQRRSFCRDISEKIKSGEIKPVKSSLINEMIEQPTVKYDFTPNKHKVSVNDMIKQISNMAEFDALTASAKRKYVESTFNNEK